MGVGDGLTCCQANDVINPVSTLRRRIDFVLFRGGWTPTLAETLGDDQLDRTPSGTMAIGPCRGRRKAEVAASVSLG